jgi:3-oxoadipate enol-lactonase
VPTIAVNETELYYEDTGPGSTGETIVFSHGLLWDTSLFAPQIAALRDRYRCIAWDHRGQGRSASDHRHCIDMELLTQDAAALLGALGASRAHVIGLSMGGFVAMRLAARRPSLVDKLILIETSADPEPRENVPRYRMLSRVARVLGPAIIGKRVAPIMLGASILADPGRRADVKRYLTVMTARRDIWRAVNGVIDRAGCHDELPQIAAPCLILVGDEDVATTPAKAARLAAAIRGARLVHIPRAGHSSTVEAPREVTAAIESFLA